MRPLGRVLRRRRRRVTTLVLRPVMRKTNKVHFCRPRFLHRMRGLYERCHLLLVFSRVTANFKEAKGLFT